MQFFGGEAAYVTRGAASQEFREWTCMMCDTNECNAFSMEDLDKCEDCETQVNGALGRSAAAGWLWLVALLAAGWAALAA